MNSTQLKSRQLNQNINILLGTHVTRLAIPESGLGLQYCTGMLLYVLYEYKKI